MTSAPAHGGGREDILMAILTSATQELRLRRRGPWDTPTEDDWTDAKTRRELERLARKRERSMRWAELTARRERLARLDELAPAVNCHSFLLEPRAACCELLSPARDSEKSTARLLRVLQRISLASALHARLGAGGSAFGLSFDLIEMVREWLPVFPQLTVVTRFHQQGFCGEAHRTSAASSASITTGSASGEVSWADDETRFALERLVCKRIRSTRWAELQERRARLAQMEQSDGAAGGSQPTACQVEPKLCGRKDARSPDSAHRGRAQGHGAGGGEIRAALPGSAQAVAMPKPSPRGLLHWPEHEEVCWLSLGVCARALPLPKSDACPVHGSDSDCDSHDGGGGGNSPGHFTIGSNYRGLVSDFLGRHAKSYLLIEFTSRRQATAEVALAADNQGVGGGPARQRSTSPATDETAVELMPTIHALDGSGHQIECFRPLRVHVHGW